jgi:hypothetical protein
MSFHDSTYRLLQSDPEVSTDAQRRLIEAERRLGILLPSSILQWYERRNAIPVLAEHSNDDPPVEIEQIETIAWRGKLLLPIRRCRASLSRRTCSPCYRAIAFHPLDRAPIGPEKMDRRYQLARRTSSPAGGCSVASPSAAGPFTGLRRAAVVGPPFMAGLTRCCPRDASSTSPATPVHGRSRCRGFSRGGTRATLRGRRERNPHPA